MIKNEFQLIDTLTKNFLSYHDQLEVGVGDDAAVVKHGDKYLLMTCDTIVENDHFNCLWSTPEQIGRKAAEVNVSDIAASGGRPTYMLISLVLTKDTAEDWIVRVYDGIKQVCDKYGISLVGGDTTHGSVKIINITLLGETDKPILRSGAKVGDLIGVTGVVGGSNAGLKLFLKGAPVSGLLRQKYLEPIARLDVSDKIAKYANSLIDVSDGVASEVSHICQRSGVGAVVWAEKLPLCAGAVVEDALSGGEDFELLFTVPEKDLNKLKDLVVDLTVIGQIVDKNQGVIFMRDGKQCPMPGGYDHFKN